MSFFQHYEMAVTPAKAGVHHLTPKFIAQVMDSRVDLRSPSARGNDEVLELKGLAT
jgi:hypothetical protein